MKVLLIGATGLLGHNVARQLLSLGHQVASPKHRLQALDEAAHGCQAVVNCAGCTDMSLLHLEDYMPANRDAVRIICEAMEAHGISTLVHVSTANTIGYHHANEESPWESPFRESLYAQSKKAGEEIVDAMALKHPDWHIITVHPGFMLGPLDYKPSSGKLLNAAYRRRVMLVPKGGKSFVPVCDVAAAIVNALERGSHGAHYLLTGYNITLKEFYRTQAQACGYKQLILSLPNWLMLSLAKAGDLLRFCHIRTQLSSRNVRQLLVSEHYSNKRARQELMLPLSPLRDAILAYFNKDQWNCPPAS